MRRARYGGHGSSLRDLARLRDSRRRRASSWDRSGGNDDFLRVPAGATATLADIAGAGSINHIWMTTAGRSGPAALEPDYLRKLVLRMYWDGEPSPSVAVPLGDFFGAGHARTVSLQSLPLTCSPAGGRAFNSFWHMPFAGGARVEVANECVTDEIVLYYYVDYEEFDELEDGLGRFHAQWRRANPAAGEPQRQQTNAQFLFGGRNTTGRDNYVILDASGRGHYVGCMLFVHNLRGTRQWDWWGEGDDMIFIDQDGDDVAGWPPTLHGTGTEDYFNTAYCPREAFSAPYHGIPLAGGENWSGQATYYRFHVEDPVTFQRSIRVTIEHGHANKRSDDYASVAYWYQAEPHAPFTLPPMPERVPWAQ